MVVVVVVVAVRSLLNAGKWIWRWRTQRLIWCRTWFVLRCMQVTTTMVHPEPTFQPQTAVSAESTHRGGGRFMPGQDSKARCHAVWTWTQCSVSDMKETEIRKDRFGCWLPLFSHYFIPTLPLSFFGPPHVAFDHPWPWLFAFFWAKTDAGEEPWILQGLSWVVIIYNNIIDGHNRKLSRCVVSSDVWGI